MTYFRGKESISKDLLGDMELAINEEFQEHASKEGIDVSLANWITFKAGYDLAERIFTGDGEGISGSSADNSKRASR